MKQLKNVESTPVTHTGATSLPPTKGGSFFYRCLEKVEYQQRQRKSQIQRLSEVGAGSVAVKSF